MYGVNGHMTYHGAARGAQQQGHQGQAGGGQQQRGVQPREGRKPTCIIDYNNHMGGVDRADQVSFFSTNVSVRNLYILLLDRHLLLICFF